MALLKNLNPEQLAAVRHKDGPLLIVAGAGTGKTTVIAQRIAYLIEQGLAGPDEILALTFTEKAAGEMADRVGDLLPYGYFDLWISTFHGFSERILREHGLAIGLSTDFKLLNEFEQWALVKKNLDKFELDYYRPLGAPAKFIHALLKHFSRAKDEDISPAVYLEYADGLKQNLDGMLGGSSVIPISHLSFPKPQAVGNPGGKGKNAVLDPRLRGDDKKGWDDKETTDNKIMAQEAARLNEVANGYHVYQQLLLDNDVLDFGDLINYSLKLFRQRPAILEKYRWQFKHVLLDEFQDTNWSQYELIKILAGPAANLAVVGDDDQSIFRFRGASMSNILQFAKDYPRAKKIILTKNYRSGQNILDLSYEFIKQNNPNRLEWQLQKISPLTRGDKGGLSGDKTPSNSPLSGGGLNKKLVAQNLGQAEIEVIEGADLDEEVKLVADKIVALKNAGANGRSPVQVADKIVALKNAGANGVRAGADGLRPSWDDFAILVRANDSANVFMAELDRRGLPYLFGARRGLYLKPVILDAMAYFKLLDNYHESVSLWRILNLPVFKFSDLELMNFNHLAKKKAWSLYEVLNRADALKFSAETGKKIKPVLALIAKHTAMAREKAASEIFLAFMNESGYLKHLIGQTDFCHLEEPSPSFKKLELDDERSIINDKREKQRIKDSSPAFPRGQNDKETILTEQKSLKAMSQLNQFLKRIRDFEAASADKTVKSFLAEILLEMEAGEAGELAIDSEAGPEAIKILTVHAAKGLEFKYVFIANLVDKRFPTIERGEPISLPEALIKEILPEGDAHLAEERRLFYVAMTRAKLGLYFSWAPDYGGKAKKKPSRFLMEAGLVKTSPLTRGDKGGLKALVEFSSPLNARGDNITPLHPPLSGGRMPARFSYSQLAAYSNCPYQYRFAHILKIPVMGKEQFSFGQTLHATLQKLFALINEKKGLGQAELFEKPPLIPPCQGGEKTVTPLTRGERGVASPLYKGEKWADKGGVITFEEILELYEQSWIDDWYKDKTSQEEHKKQGREILKGFYEKHQNNWPQALFLEKGFNLKIADPSAKLETGGQRSYLVRGVIDRIDLVPLVPPSSRARSTYFGELSRTERSRRSQAEGNLAEVKIPSAGPGQAGGLKLVDYKTGRAKKDLSFVEKEQLFIYQLAAQELFKQPVRGLAFYYLTNNSEVEFIGQPEDLAKIKDKIISAIKEIERGEFPPRPSRLCAWCDFREICEFRE